MNDMIVSRQDTRNLGDRGDVSLMHFHHGHVVLISADAVGYYRDEDAIFDPLGNGVLGYEVIPASVAPHWVDGVGFIAEQRAGFVGLTSGAVIFIRPDGIGLYNDGASALRNIEPYWLIPFSPLP
jgi:hypothetical protein